MKIAKSNIILDLTEGGTANVIYEEESLHVTLNLKLKAYTLSALVELIDNLKEVVEFSKSVVGRNNLLKREEVTEITPNDLTEALLAGTLDVGVNGVGQPRVNRDDQTDREQEEWNSFIDDTCQICHGSGECQICHGEPQDWDGNIICSCGTGFCMTCAGSGEKIVETRDCTGASRTLEDIERLTRILLL